MSKDINYHIPVMVQEVIEGLQINPGKRYIDATIGGGGHGVEIVRRGGLLLGIDQDTEAIEEVKRIFKDWKIVQGNFRDIGKLAREHGFSEVDGVLFDLGVSGHQLDSASRGFSYRFGDAPLDLRLDQKKGRTAADIIARASEEELYEIFAKYGEEERAGAIAHAVVLARRVKPIATTGQLAAIVSESQPTLSRVFQALRIAVNDELEALREGLLGSESLLVSGGRLAVISFHSLEDRIVKEFFKRAIWKMITKRPQRASFHEVEENIRSRSAKLRVAEKL
ncbi:MAG: 16S rRNA (cytosine(1402)-N(4))-methyltransferase RsmH [Patescibacteria group bacterium]